MASRTPNRPVAQSPRIVSVSDRDESFVFVAVVVRIYFSSTSATASTTPRSTREVGSFFISDLS